MPEAFHVSYYVVCKVELGERRQGLCASLLSLLAALLVLLLRLEHLRQVLLRGWVGWINLQDLGKRFHGASMVGLRHQHETQIVVRARVLWIQRDGGAVSGLGISRVVVEYTKTAC